MHHHHYQQQQHVCGRRIRSVVHSDPHSDAERHGNFQRNFYEKFHSAPVDLQRQFHAAFVTTLVAHIEQLVGDVCLCQSMNSLPDFIRDPTSSTDCFRRLLETYLFARY